MSTAAMLGIDISKRELACTLIYAGTEQPAWQRAVPNTTAGFAKLLKATPPEASWVLEPTGRYGLALVKEAQAAGRNVLLAPPRKAKQYLASLDQRAKNDPLDSYGLAMFGLSRAMTQPLAPYPTKSEKVDRVDQLLSARKGLSRAIARLKLQRAELPYAVEPLTNAIEAMEKELKALDKQIAAETKDAPEFEAAKRLMQVPGIGTVTATAVVSRLAAKQFAHPDQFVAYLGLDLRVRESGKRKGKTALTKEGDAELRRLLYLCAQASQRCKDSPFKAQYEREKAKGLPTTGALCAVARKMARLCWSIHKHGTSYDPARVYQRPPKPEPLAAVDPPAAWPDA